MKAKYTKELNKINLNLDIEAQYEEDYQVIMIQKNDIFGLLKMNCLSVDGKSRFVYDVSGMKSMKKRYESQKLKGQDILIFVETLLQTISEMRKFMLNPDCLLLHPAYIFYSGEKWHFLYQPLKRSSMDQAFHELTEYFVRTLDYEEKEGIQLAYELHKETMQDNYNLEQIIKIYKEKVAEPEKVEEITENILFAEEEYPVVSDVATVHEKREGFHPFRMVGERLRKSKWGNWEDLIVEADRQEE